MAPWPRRLIGCLATVLVLLVWQQVSMHTGARSNLFPPPLRCAAALVEWIKDKSFLIDLKASLGRFALGMFFGTSVGAVLGVLTGVSKVAEAGILPVMRLLRNLPPVALLPLFIVWFGIELRSQVLAIGVAVVFPVWLSVYTGIRRIPLEYLWVSRVMRFGTAKTFFRVILPASVPMLITGLRLAVAVAFVMVFVSELLGADSGVGYRISTWQLAYRMDAMIAALLVLGVLGAAADSLIAWVPNLAFPWLRYSGTEGGV